MITHEEYIAQGYCPATINLTPRKGKRGRTPEPTITWCLKLAQHAGPHETLSLAPRIGAEYVHWSDETTKPPGHGRERRMSHPHARLKGKAI